MMEDGFHKLQSNSHKLWRKNFYGACPWTWQGTVQNEGIKLKLSAWTNRFIDRFLFDASIFDRHVPKLRNEKLEGQSGTDIIKLFFTITDGDKISGFILMHDSSQLEVSSWLNAPKYSWIVYSHQFKRKSFITLVPGCLTLGNLLGAAEPFPILNAIDLNRGADE